MLAHLAEYFGLFSILAPNAMESNNNDNMNNSNFWACASPSASSGSSSMMTPSSSPPGLAGISASSSMETPTADVVDAAIVKLFPKRTPPKIKEADCIDKADLFGIDWHVLDDHEKRVLSFLFWREVHQVLFDESKAENKVGWVEEMLRAAMDASSDIGQRVLVILQERGHMFYQTVPQDVHKYDDFLLKHPAWGEKESSGEFVNLLEALEPFQQVQMSGNCYLHAAVLVYHYYARWHSIPNAEYHLIDIVRWMRQNFTGKEIYTHLFEGGGGRSENILRKLVGQAVHPRATLTPFGRSEGFAESRSNEAKVFLNNLENFGPLLFSNALLPDDFCKKSDSHSFSGTTSKFMGHEEGNKPEERHAMVLMGIRKGKAKEEGDWFFLFQNSHRENQFFEADYDWVAKTQGTPYCNWYLKGTWTPPNPDETYVYNELAVYSEASPSVSRPDSGDATKSFTFPTGNEK